MKPNLIGSKPAVYRSDRLHGRLLVDREHVGRFNMLTQHEAERNRQQVGQCIAQADQIVDFWWIESTLGDSRCSRNGEDNDERADLL